ncbi:MAG: hypothetical protein IT300_02365 [Dehalococcoidia bacterium]|nr:hypothetical protein [Dehalococcoidia bacterium]
MSDRYGTDYPEDEPVIGGGYAPPAPPPLTPPGQPQYAGTGVGANYEDDTEDALESYEDDEYDEDDYEDDEDSYGYYDEYEDSAPARQPMFYVFVALAALVGGIVVFLLFSLVNNGNGGSPSGGGDTKFAVSIDSPPKDKRVEIGKMEEVIVQASATEAITRFELFVGDKLTDTVTVSETPADNKYRAVMKFTLTARGNYDLMVRVTASSGATKESSKVRVIAIEPVGERPQTIKGKVVADTTLRSGPADTYPESGTLKAGTEVTILGKNKSVDWLLIDSAQGQRWAKRTAIDPLDSLELVPVRDVTPTPAPTQEATSTSIPSPSASASTSPTANPNAPDFVPTNAVLIEGGAKLRVTVQNVSTNAYNGPLVIGVSGDIASSELAIDAKLAGNGGTATVDFEVAPPITTTGKKAVVSVDPKNAVKEAREDNNGATFVLLPPEESPVIVIQTPTVQPSAISITVQNTGGALAATTVTVRVKLGSSVTLEEKSIALAKNQSATFTVARPQGTGEATAEVVINGQVVASAQFTISP